MIANEKSAPRLVSLFSGCGGMDKGFEQAGFQRVWANDFDKDAQAVFRLNFGEIDGRDIREVPVDEIPACDILTAGFPCQPFSNAGNRRGVYDSRGELYLECLRIIERKLPKAVLFENVKGLISSKHQSGQYLIEVIKGDLEKLGYAVNYRVVNASDYGVPQNRERLILVAFRNDLGKRFEFPPVQLNKENLTLRHMQERIDAATARYHELGDSIKATETRMAEIAVLRTHIVNYARTRPVYDAYRKAGYSKRFLDTHREEITLHKAAKTAFDEAGLKKLPKAKDLSIEYAELLKKKKESYPDYRKARDEMQELMKAQKNVEMFFAEEKSTTEKGQAR